MSRPIPVWLVAVTATALALAVWVLAVPVAGVDLAAGTPAQTVGAASVVVATLVVTLGAWGVRTAAPPTHPGRLVAHLRDRAGDLPARPARRHVTGCGRHPGRAAPRRRRDDRGRAWTLAAREPRRRRGLRPASRPVYRSGGATVGSTPAAGDASHPARPTASASGAAAAAAATGLVVARGHRVERVGRARVQAVAAVEAVVALDAVDAAQRVVTPPPRSTSAPGPPTSVSCHRTPVSTSSPCPPSTSSMSGEELHGAGTPTESPSPGSPSPPSPSSVTVTGPVRAL